jgi:hypothetical protein
MKVACTNNNVAAQVVAVLTRYGTSRGVSWQGGSPLDERIWVAVNAVIDPTVEAAIRREIESIAGATIHD